MTFKKFIALWTIRFEFSNRYANIAFRFLQIAIFCKVFEMKPIGYATTVAVSILFVVVISWLADKLKLVHETQSIIWNKTPEFHKIMKELEGIRKDLKAERLRNRLGY